jgi:hypothetical protein
MLPPPGQVGIRDLQEEKCQGKRKRKKTSSGQHGALTWRRYKLDHSCVARKVKQSAVTTMIQQVHNQYQTNVATKTAEAKTTNANKKRKAKPKKANEKDTSRPAETILQDMSNTPEVAEETTIRLCGCRYGDLSEVKSFAKAMATYYSRPNKFMEGTCCLDCRLAVPNMESNACGRRAVVYYCDEGIKGFDAPDDDPMKSALTCDLILCLKCEARRRIEYNKVNSERQSGGIKRSRRQTGVQN